VEETELRRQAVRLGLAGERQERQAAALWVAREVGGEVVQRESGGMKTASFCVLGRDRWFLLNLLVIYEIRYYWLDTDRRLLGTCENINLTSGHEYINFFIHIDPSRQCLVFFAFQESLVFFT
jgi:hypothetical protein